MTLARYTGPLVGLRGAIGRLASGGVEIAGRVRRGTVESPVYRVGDVAFDSWPAAARALSTWLAPIDPVAAQEVRDATPDPAGLTVSAGGEVYRLTVS